MATRDNQGLQIALIIFVILTIVLIVTTYMFFRSYSDERDKGKALAQQNSDKDAAMQKAIAESANFRALITPGESDTYETVKAAADKDLKTHGESLTEKSQNYRGLVEHLVAKIRKQEEALAKLTDENKALAEKLKTNDDAAKAQIAKYADELATTAADLKKVREAFEEQRGQMTQQQAQLAAKAEETQKKYDTDLAKSANQVTTLVNTLAKTEQLLTALRNKDELEKKANEFPDGKITHVNQRNRTVYLNVGAADGLQRQTSFVIVAPEDGNPIKSKPKGTIEVVNLTGPHQAKARIVEDDLSNPIMPGDQIFSVVWEAGRPEHFALAGRMDVDGDGESDRERIRNLITMSGGVVDAEVSDDGKRSGEMSIHTKYLVLGEQPGPTSPDREAYGALYSEAQTLGVETIDVHRFVDYLGYHAQDRTVNLGRQAKPTDFKPRLPNGFQRTMPRNAADIDPRRPRTSPQGSP